MNNSTHHASRPEMSITDIHFADFTSPCHAAGRLLDLPDKVHLAHGDTLTPSGFPSTHLLLQHSRSDARGPSTEFL